MVMFSRAGVAKRAIMPRRRAPPKSAAKGSACYARRRSEAANAAGKCRPRTIEDNRRRSDRALPLASNEPMKVLPCPHNSVTSLARLTVETAFTVLGMARTAQGRRARTSSSSRSATARSTARRRHARAASKRSTTTNRTTARRRAFRSSAQAAAEFVREEFDIPAQAEQHRRGPGREGVRAVLLRSVLEPRRRRARLQPVFPDVSAEHRAPRRARRARRRCASRTSFRPDVADIERFLRDDPSPRAIFLNSPHNPTGGVTTQQDLRDIADLVRGRDVADLQRRAVLPHGLERQRTTRCLSQPGHAARSASAAYTFSKSYSMSGWRLGFAVAAPEVADVIGKMINTTLSCTPPIVQLAGTAALETRSERNATRSCSSSARRSCC